MHTGLWSQCLIKAPGVRSETQAEQVETEYTWPFKWTLAAFRSRRYIPFFLPKKVIGRGTPMVSLSSSCSLHHTGRCSCWRTTSWAASREEWVASPSHPLTAAPWDPPAIAPRSLFQLGKQAELGVPLAHTWTETYNQAASSSAGPRAKWKWWW